VRRKKYYLLLSIFTWVAIVVQAPRFLVALARRKDEREIFRVVRSQKARFNCSTQRFCVAHPNETSRRNCSPVFDPRRSFGWAQNGHRCEPTLLFEACWKDTKGEGDLGFYEMYTSFHITG